MKIIGIKTCVLAAMLFSVCMIGCKKDKDVKKRECKLVLLSTATNGISIIYDEQGRFSTVTGTNSNRFTYSGNTITIKTFEAGVLDRTTTVIVNANGLATNINVKEADGIRSFNTANEYNGTELVRSTGTSSDGGPPSISNYTWVGGNMVATQTDNGNIQRFEYSSTILSQDGDTWHNLALQQGFEAIRTKNALLLIDTGGTPSTVSYVFDTEGKIISSLSIANGSLFKIDYTYECH